MSFKSVHGVSLLDMNVGVVVQTDFPDVTQVRPRKIAKKLNEEGTDRGFVFARDERATEQDVSYTTVERFAWGKGTPLFGLLTSKIPFNPFWIIWLAIRFVRDDIDVVVGSDIRAGFPAIIAGKIVSVPVILDLQENNAARQRRLPVESLSHLVTRNYRIIDAFELFCVRQADEVWVVVEERKHPLIRAGVPEQKFTVINNTPLLSEFDEHSDTDETFEWSGFSLIYVGVVTRIRGLELAIKALPHFPKEDDDVQVVIAGEGEYTHTLESLATELEVADRVHFLGRIPQESFANFLQAGDVGLILREINEHHNTAMPNKLYDYMMAETPVVATNLDPVRRILEDTNAGTVLPRDVTPEEFAERVSELRHGGELNEYGTNGRTAVETEYNWSEEWKLIRASLERVAKSGR